jgi:hypothetical protein
MSPPSTSTPDPVPPPFWLTFLPVCQITARNVSPLHLHSRPSVPSCSSTQRTLSFFTCLWIICHLYECLMSHSRPKLDGFSALLFVSLTPPHGPTLSIPLHCPSQFLCCQLTAIIACRITQRFRAPRRSPLNLTQPQPPIHSLAGNTDL